MLISVIPFLFDIYFNIPSWLVIAAILNADFAAGDLIAIVLILNQVPKQPTAKASAASIKLVPNLVQLSVFS